jgi:hypothetical protein
VVQVVSKDSGDLSFSQDLTLTVSDVNEAPTDIVLSSSTIQTASRVLLCSVQPLLRQLDPARISSRIKKGTGLKNNSSRISLSGEAVTLIQGEEVGGAFPGEVAAPIFKKIVSGTLRIMGIPPDENTKS